MAKRKSRKTKKCAGKGCGKTKKISEFSKSKSTKDGLYCYCKECQRKHSREYRKTHLEECRGAEKKYRDNNKEKILVRKRKYRKRIKNKLRQYFRDYRNKNREKYNKQEQNNLKNNPARKMRRMVSRMIRRALQNNNSSKNGKSCFEYLGYTSDELWQHLEAQFSSPENLMDNGKVWMTKENHGTYDPDIWNDNDPATWTWNIDHIIPQSELPFKSMKSKNFKKCWSLDNLRPYSAKQNIIDGGAQVRHQKTKKKQPRRAHK